MTTNSAAAYHCAAVSFSGFHESRGIGLGKFLTIGESRCIDFPLWDIVVATSSGLDSM